ncbi:MAG: phosphatidate cytidylyltransferase [Alphaproteobacteria bacterium]|nr:phosphatidate cytidylyltransferase [Alphaproteobacteria bacterium]
MANNTILDKNLLFRVITSLILAPLVLAIIHTGGTLFNILIMISAILMAFEWNHLTSKSSVNKSPALWKFIGVFYIATPCISLIFIESKNQGSLIIFWLFITVWASDISAFFVGKIVGGPKLAPKISPKKTWSGFLATLVASYFIGVESAVIFQSHYPNALITLTVTIAVYAQIGDLIESWIKRKFEVKDSGSILPGHGGILDRVDGIVVTAPKIAILLAIGTQYNPFF